jgi:hypothetical protein
VARKPSTRTFIPDLPEQPDHAEMMALELTEFEDTRDTVNDVYATAAASIGTVTGIEAETHHSYNPKGFSRVGMRLGTFKRITDHLLFLDISNVALRSAVSDAFDKLEDSDRQRDELKTATVGASHRIKELEGLLAHEHSKAEALVEIAREPPVAAQTLAVAEPAVDTSALAELLTKVNSYRVALSTQRGGAEALLAFDAVYLAANKL